MRIGLVGGGTGGHFYPLMAVAETLREHEAQPELFYFGPSSYDKETLRKNNIRFVYTPAGKLRRYWSPLNILDVFKNGAGFVWAIIRLYLIMPDVIFSKGGFTSVPVLLAARFLRIPVVIHESDSVPGRANTLAKKFARYIAISYPEVAESFPSEKTALTGIPIRRVLKEPHPDPFTELSLDPNLPLIFITGGSSGAERLNNLVLDSLDELLPHYQILHQTGVAQETTVRNTASELHANNQYLGRYFVSGQLTAVQMSAALTAASVVVSRAGSTAIFEIARHHKPAILIPIPETISRDQRSNAYAYARTGAASVIEEHNISDGLLAGEIAAIMSDANRYQQMSTAAASFVLEDAAAKISDILISIGYEHE